MAVASSFPFWFVSLHVILFSFSVSLLQHTSIIADALGNETDRIALLKFKESISNDPYGVMSSWNDSIHFCNWHGITCGFRQQRIRALNLSGQNLRGTISPYIGNLSFLRILDLQSDNFFGQIPHQVGLLFRLQHLNLSRNMLVGTIPVNLSFCSQLKSLIFGGNNLVGIVPSSLGSLMKLKLLDLWRNNLTGGIPPSLGNISSLDHLTADENNLVGSLPGELGKLKSLTLLEIGVNNLSGTIPPSIYNITSLRTLAVAENQLKGTLPPNIGLTLPNIKDFFFGGNEFSGTIPESFSNASQLQRIDFSVNKFIGQVPYGFGNLPNLKVLTFSQNMLGSYSTNSLDFVAYLTNCSHLEVLDLSVNYFRGALPNSVANLSTKFTELYMGGNQISGNIPATLENLVNLIILSCEYNLFIGVIPSSLGRLQSLQFLSFESNKLLGKIPSSLGNLSQLFELDLSDNKLEGNIPPNIGDCQSLHFLDIANNDLKGEIPKEIFGLSSLSILLNLSHNSLSGNLPIEVGKLSNIRSLDLSENNLIGEIPKTISDLQSLELLYLQGNFFDRSLPPTLASLKGVRYLDFSRNHFSGQIPKDIIELHSLMFLNLSFNDLDGEVPNEGVFQNASAISLFGNTRLCGGVPKLHLPKCHDEESKHKKTNHLKLALVVLSEVTIFLVVLGFLIFFWWRKSQRKSLVELAKLNLLSKVSYKTLFQATNGFNPSMLIGIGSFGSVFKGIIGLEEPVAIKVLNLQQRGAEKSFIAECNALRDIRHRNLVKTLTCCSSMDCHGNEFKALVFDFMPNGSLEKWLHFVTDDECQSRGLDLTQRLNIAIDVASAIYYLHENCDQPIIHCDLKPSNVLLNDEMTAHISNFGLARMLKNTSRSSDGQTSTIGIKGTLGYAPPEYAMGGEPSKHGDVYSNGILLLEMFTGRRPTDEQFKDDFNLHNFVKMALPGNLLQVVDSALLRNGVEETTLDGRGGKKTSNNGGLAIEAEAGNRINFKISAHVHNCLVSVLEIGVACSKESPNERMNMEDVTRELQHIRNAYAGVGIHGQKQRTD